MQSQVPNPYIDQLAVEKFKKAKRQGMWRTMMSWLRKQCNNLLSLDRDSLKGSIQGQRYAGLQTVALDQIVGSTGRSHEFDRAFFPRQTHTMDRWLSLAKANYQSVSLPPVDLVKVGDQYIVADGNHRVSVARALGQEFIEANVVEVVTAVPLPCPC
ncbi:MAG: hypothetical protein IPM53_18780 [Anaerolineaceae bacterium]|nr:hypothetical protein [Anaerolineaceae bacterium]